VQVHYSSMAIRTLPSDPGLSRSLIGYSTLNFAKYRRVRLILLRFGGIVLARPVVGHSLGTFLLAHLCSPSLTRLCIISALP
jgi:hypothetical protein